MTDISNGSNPSAGGPPPTGPAQAAAIADERKLQGVSRSLLIGVGGTGHKVLLDVRERLLQKYGSLDKLPIVAFLLLDTDQAIFRKNPDYSDAANLDNADRIHCGVYGVENLRRNLREYPHLRDWLDPRTLSGDIAQGAGAVRSRGRLAFFWNHDQIAKRISEQAQEITKDESKARAIRNGLQVSEGVTVYIVGSLLGGTGSGMFLDLAYCVKDLLKSQRMLETVGIFSIPPNTSAVAVDNRPNAYASLLELNHYTDPSTTFTAQYKADQPGIENADPPFRYTYLVDTSSPAANLGSVDRLVDMIGHSIFLDLTSEFQRQKKSNRDNFDQFLTNPDDLGCPQNYLSMGLAALHFPKEKVLRACASRLARQIVARWTEPLQKVSNIGAFTESEIGRLGLSPDEVLRQVTVVSAESGELLRDSAMAFWNNANKQYETAYPGHGRVAEFLAAKQKEQEVKLVDNDPNPDLLAKRRPNLGEYIFQIQQNLQALIPAKDRALRGFLSDCVNDPNRRHGVGRAFLDQATERFRNYIEELGRRRDQAKETLAPIAGQRDAQLGKIQNYASEWALGLIPNAKRAEIGDARNDYLRYARQWDTAFIDIRAMDAASHFYTDMLVVLDRLKEEMDAYIERMRSLDAYFRKEESDAVEAPVDVNGAILFDRGRRVEGEAGAVSYVDGDIDRRYAAYVGNGADPANSAVNTVGVDVLGDLGTAGNIYGIKDGDLNRVKDMLSARTRALFAPVENESVVEKFFEKYGQGTERSTEELRRVYALSQPFIHLQENAPNYKHHQNKEQTIVGIMHGAEGRSDAEARFLTMLRDTVQGIRDGQISNANEHHQVLFLRERAAFPLRLLEGMDSYRFAYDQAKAQGASANPIHTRKDVREWVRISPPSFEDQRHAWQTFCVAWALSVIHEEKDIRYAATGARETVRFIAVYRDRFGMAKSDPLGTFVAVTGDMAKLLQEAQSEQEISNRPPKEAREIVLLLCDQQQLKEHIDQGIEAKLQEIGVQEVGQALLQHVDAQSRRFPRPILRPYQTAITDYLEQINYNPGGPAVPVAVVSLPTPIAAVKPAVTAPAAAAAAAPASPAAAPVGGDGIASVRARLASLKALFDEELITKEDYDSRRAVILTEV
jgi:hypothetical protein